MSTLSDNVYGVILAGGSGTRFWPKSRHLTPKQLCSIGDDSLTMLEITLGRLEGFIPPERRIIVTHQDQVQLTKKTVGDRCPYVIGEPEAKNTAAAIALAALEIKKLGLCDNPVMVSLHADHVIRDVAEFKRVIETGVTVANDDQLTLFGIVPQYGETGYGYIEKGTPLSKGEGWVVKSFREKPNKKLADEYFRSKNFFWNSGLFIWKVDVILRELETHLPKTLRVLTQALEELNCSFHQMSPKQLGPYYSQLEKIAIDNAILEKSDNVAVISADFGWQDVGSWAALEQCFPTDDNGNITYGDIHLIDTKNSTIDTDGPFVATIGLEDMVVVAAKNAVLVCKKDRSQDVKSIVEHLKAKKRDELV